MRFRYALSLLALIPAGALASRLFFSQQDGRWSSHWLGYSHQTTIGDDGCAVTAMAMALQSAGTTVDPSQLNDWLTNNDGFDDGYLSRWNVAARYPGSQLTWLNSGKLSSPSDLKAAIDGGKTLISISSRFRSHDVLIAGYRGAGAAWSDFYYWDPWDDAQQDRPLGDGWVSPGNSVETFMSVTQVGKGLDDPRLLIECYQRNGGGITVGNPLGEVQTVAYGVPSQEFQSGAGGAGAIILNGPAAYWVHGAIFSRYASRAASIGLPSIEEQDAPSSPVSGRGRYQAFDKADIYSAKPGTFLVAGDVRSCYSRNGASGGKLGFPAGDETNAPTSPRGTAGHLQTFEGGAIYSSASDGAYAVTDDVGKIYNAAGGPSGRYGFPVAASRVSNGIVQQPFEGGVISVEGSAPSLEISGDVAVHGSIVEVEVTLTNGGKAPVSGETVDLLQLGSYRSSGTPWTPRDLESGASDKETFEFPAEALAGKVRLLSANVSFPNSKVRLRYLIRNR